MDMRQSCCMEKTQPLDGDTRVVKYKVLQTRTELGESRISDLTLYAEARPRRPPDSTLYTEVVSSGLASSGLASSGLSPDCPHCVSTHVELNSSPCLCYGARISSAELSGQIWSHFVTVEGSRWWVGCWAGAPGHGWTGMGGGLVCRLSPALRLPPPTPLSSLALASTSSSVFVLFVTAAVIMLLGAPPVLGSRDFPGSGRFDRQLCDIRQCWDLYEDTQSYLNVHLSYEPPQLHLDPEERDALCLSQRTFYICLEAMYRNKSLDCHSNIGFRGAFNGIGRSMENINCSREGPVFDPSQLPPEQDPGLVCTYNGAPTMRFCSLFGDPHLRTFMDEFQTCQVQGAWPLLDNRYLTVQVTSKAVGATSGPATAVTELTVMIKAHDVCAAERFVTYQAEAGFLPAVFDDGSVDFGPEKSVTLEEVVPGHHIEIYLRYIDTRIVARHYHNHVSHFLTVSLLMPEKILNQSASYLPHEDATVQTLELCSRGCPDNQQIDYMTYLTKTNGASVSKPGSDSGVLYPEEKNSVEEMTVLMTRQQALDRCRRLHLVDMYLDSCVFDLMNTGDVNFSQAAADTLADTIRLHPAGAGTLQNRTVLKDLPPYQTRNSASSLPRCPHTNTILVAMVVCAFTTWWSPWVTLGCVPAGESLHHPHYYSNQ